VRKSNTAKSGSVGKFIGIACGSFGQYEQAIDDREKFSAIDREIKHSQGEATSLNNIGSVYRQVQQTEKAIKKYQGGQYLVGCG
jgi:tetratricopeptide (TPR) repeat protein